MEEARRGKEKVSDLDPRGDFGDDDGPADIDALRPALERFQAGQGRPRGSSPESFVSFGSSEIILGDGRG